MILNMTFSNHGLNPLMTLLLNYLSEPTKKTVDLFDDDDDDSDLFGGSSAAKPAAAAPPPEKKESKKKVVTYLISELVTLKFGDLSHLKLCDVVI